MGGPDPLYVCMQLDYVKRVDQMPEALGFDWHHPPGPNPVNKVLCHATNVFCPLPERRPNWMDPTLQAVCFDCAGIRDTEYILKLPKSAAH